MGWDGMGWDGMGWGWDGMGWDGMCIFFSLFISSFVLFFERSFQFSNSIIQGGKEALHSNRFLHKIICDCIENVTHSSVSRHAISLISDRTGEMNIFIFKYFFIFFPLCSLLLSLFSSLFILFSLYSLLSLFSSSLFILFFSLYSLLSLFSSLFILFFSLCSLLFSLPIPSPHQHSVIAEVNQLLSMSDVIDLVIPRGSGKMVSR
jgi:hypothetical protein